MPKILKITPFLLMVYTGLFAQQFETLPPEFISGSKPLVFSKILCTQKGGVLVANTFGVLELDGMKMTLPFTAGELTDNKGHVQPTGKNSNLLKDITELKTGIRLLCEGPGGIIYAVNENNNFGCMAYNRLGPATMMAPFNFYPPGDTIKKNITAIWVSDDSDLYVATNTDTMYFIAGAGSLFNNQNKFMFMPGFDKDSNYVIVQGAKPIKKFSLGNGIIPYCFARYPDDKRTILIGTNNGLYGYDKQTGQSFNYIKSEEKLTITSIENDSSPPFIWFSTLEKGMGRLNVLSETATYFTYPKKQAGINTKYPVADFSRMSANQFFVAVADSLPAVFNTETGNYQFINDTIFHNSVNQTTDIKKDAFGHLLLTKGGKFYWSKTFLRDNEKMYAIDSSLAGPYITDITINGEDYSKVKSFPNRYELLPQLNLKYNENKIRIVYSCRGIASDSLVFAYKLDNQDEDWTIMPFSVFEKLNLLNFSDLNPGTYTLHIKARNGTQAWLKNEVKLVIIIAYPFWQTWWFWLSVIIAVGLLVWFSVQWRVKVVRKQERIKAKHEKDLLELEAKALRAQMNPHFIFNCINSIKSLIQKNEQEPAINYLMTFSKLIRTVFQHSDKREISLYDEIETCRLYLQLESMRFHNRLSYVFHIDKTLDLKSVMVPALIIQPFIENAIWHGIMPKEEGGCVTISVNKQNGQIACLIDDDGIGRVTSQQNKFRHEDLRHESKGEHLTQARLNLNNILNEQHAKIEIIDKKDEHDKPAGTRVIIYFEEY